MKVSLLASFLVHVILFLAFQMGFPSFWVDGEFRTYKVSLVRVSHDSMDRNGVPDKDQPKNGQHASPEDGTDTISLDTHDKRYVSYARAIKERIQKNWEYPSEAREGGVEGRLTLLFSLEQNGTLTGVVIRKGSGSDILDKEATRAISASAPFPPFPENIMALKLNIRAAFDYRLK
ncbi:MAG: energy transducer TonB [Pseudomonadota bacterium]